MMRETSREHPRYIYDVQNRLWTPTQQCTQGWANFRSFSHHSLPHIERGKRAQSKAHCKRHLQLWQRMKFSMFQGMPAQWTAFRMPPRGLGRSPQPSPLITGQPVTRVNYGIKLLPYWKVPRLPNIENRQSSPSIPSSTWCQGTVAIQRFSNCVPHVKGTRI